MLRAGVEYHQGSFDMCVGGGVTPLENLDNRQFTFKKLLVIGQSIESNQTKFKDEIADSVLLVFVYTI